MLKFRVGVVSAWGSQALAAYLTEEQLTVGDQALARYYAGETAPLPEAELGRAIARGDIGFSEAVDQLMQAYRTVGQAAAELERHEQDIQDKLTAAATRARQQLGLDEAGGVAGRLRAAMPPEVARALGLDPMRAPTQTELANLLNGQRADGEPLQGKQIQAPMLPLTAIFGLDEATKPSAAAVGHVLNGRRVDGSEPRTAGGEDFRDGVVAGAIKRFMAIYGAQGEPTPAHVTAIQAGQTIEGLSVNDADYARKVNATKAPVAYTELVWSSDKNLSIAWALAPTEAERALLQGVHRNAVDKTMAFFEAELGRTRQGKAGAAGVKQGRLGWVILDHYTARPVAEIATTGPDGEPYTEFASVPVPKMGMPDMHLHSHVIVPNAVILPDGKVGSMDGDELEGRVKEFGAVFQAFEAAELRALGVKVALDEATGAARIQTIPDALRNYHSKRSMDGENEARRYAADQGLVWDELDADRKLKLMRGGMTATRNRKTERTGTDDFAAWRKQTAALGYQHKSVLGTAPVEPDRDLAEQRQRSHERSLPLVDALFQRKATIRGQDLRELAARGMVDGGISDKPGEDIATITRAYRTHGVVQNGAATGLLWSKEAGPRGKDRVLVTTGQHEAIERELVRLAEAAYRDRSSAIPKDVLDRHVAKFLADNPKIDPTDPHWQTQRAGLYEIGTGGKLSGFIGAAGAGKTTVLEPVVSAAHERGKTVYGVALANAHTVGLRGAGIKDENRASLRAFMLRVKRGRYQLDDKAVVVIDEFSRMGSKDFLDLLQLREQRGFEIKFTGDPEQTQSIEAPVFGVLTKAFPEGTFPEISTSRRMATERDRDIAGLYRAGDAAAALAMQAEDGNVRLVAGGRQATIDAVARLWRARTEQNAGQERYSLTVSAPTNQDAHDIGVAVRKQMRAMDRLGEPEIKLAAVDGMERNKTTLTLSVGDRIRLFDRIHLDKGKVLGNNSDLLEVVAFNHDGIMARNDQGVEGLVRYNKITATDGVSVRLGYGYSRTIDSVQSVTATEHIAAMPSGSAIVEKFKGYTQESRAVVRTITVINESAERQQILHAIPTGAPRPTVRDADILANVAANLSRSPEKRTALDFIEGARALERGAVRNFRVMMAPIERTGGAVRQAGAALKFQIDRMEAQMAPLIARMRDHAIGRTMSPQPEREIGRSMSR